MLGLLLLRPQLEDELQAGGDSLLPSTIIRRASAQDSGFTSPCRSSSIRFWISALHAASLSPSPLVSRLSISRAATSPRSSSGSCSPASSTWAALLVIVPPVSLPRSDFHYHAIEVYPTITLV